MSSTLFSAEPGTAQAQVQAQAPAPEHPHPLAIFDLDGTIVNTIADLGESVSYALKTLGLPQRTLEEYTRFVGNGTLKLIERSLPDDYKTDSDLIAKAHDLFSDYYSRHYADHSVVYEGIPEALTELKKRGLRLCVLTNKPDRFAKRIIWELFGEELFDMVLGARDGIPKKPDPAAELEIMRELGAQASKAVHIGDSDVDILTARSAGIKCIAVSWGFRPKESLISADIIIDTPNELTDAVADLGLF